jgi:hypothetical protein
VSLTRRTEARIGISGLGGIDLGADGTLLAPPTPPGRRIEFVGDSELLGYGAGMTVESTNMCRFSPDTEDADASVAKLTSDALGAQMMNLAFSGKGVTRNLTPGDTQTLPKMYPLSIPTDPNTVWDAGGGWTPDVVVIDAGANDLRGTLGQRSFDDTDGFVKAYEAFVRSLRTGHPQATIVCVVSATVWGGDRAALTGAVMKAVNDLHAAGDPHVVLFDFFANDPNNQSYGDAERNEGLGYGCDYHPSRAGAAFLAKRLAAANQQQMGW